MKRTDMERRDRDLKRLKKKEEAQERREEKNASSLSGTYTDKLYQLFFYNEEKIYNIAKSPEIRKLIEEINTKFPEKEMDNIIRRAIRMTKVQLKKPAFDEIKALLD